jgi:hypothetical protein
MLGIYSKAILDSAYATDPRVVFLTSVLSYPLGSDGRNIGQHFYTRRECCIACTRTTINVICKQAKNVGRSRVGSNAISGPSASQASGGYPYFDVKHDRDVSNV